MKQRRANERIKKKIEKPEKDLREKVELWEKSVPSHKVIQKEEKFENKLKKYFYLNNLQAFFFVKEHLHALSHFLQFVSYLLKSKNF